MLTRFSVRRKSKDVFQKVITLRKLGYSYSEIIKETGVAKSTINSWITFAGLNLSPEHMQIQLKKRVQNHVLGTLASKITRLKRRDEDVQNFISEQKVNFNDPLFVAGVMLYEAEGTKSYSNGFSNSDFRLINLYIKFLEKYFRLSKKENMSFRLYIHEIRKSDLERIKRFWSKKLIIDVNKFAISWKHNIVAKQQENLDYVGQLSVNVRKMSHFISKMVTLSDIILTRYQKL
ncbi:MAG: hypothetical protein UR39_C0004G0060 [Candidatus Woesebacteria bacterium GW2011_GWA1_33_30]|uniref:Uncharacterized protein n=1 Tax=Candidatus Woesebacteria bacterium GW2011_GWA2_33_28 TaxID=1618561 RepID=A0A0G0C8A8_9BACT|nr:MAG: hypothetical protein UR38_C0004G0013 [Candidatus Woesebacteria bacterium GW2011_GWA2_33_28]KKP48439.1 MAG: hypothetical protein UR39_C0004G0060 [Candidatus Woesebacteria bacterium GW2011_GWA1_33_30]KKP49546.1 MAG: hypothetical protein UR40_C0005G0060 [Microgenomates group bacterium GW2011_GWC1_33_32]KKP52511.1 MAG: hypothetical protein UR44_C0002G0060 [Candidatus Woesebacteria bacterium GW2011_GWB1_33_38]KKP56369.1 MAG: hypothetical protein UR48_C0035G0006 [Microgenomates group bacteriu